MALHFLCQTEAWTVFGDAIGDKRFTLARGANPFVIVASLLRNALRNHLIAVN